MSVGDPLGIISLSLSLTFSQSVSETRQYEFTIPAGVSGRIGFTPIYLCTSGTLTCRDGEVSDKTLTCSPWKPADSTDVQGDYSLVQS